MPNSETAYIPLSTIDFENFALDLTKAKELIGDGFTAYSIDQYENTNGEKGIVIGFKKDEPNIPYLPIYRG